ncbi:DUF1810 domain-containing protein [Ovoidimarina sediminis]|uniref:DUF1810 domain-containing protein n=1 Tax=Ovoidimarina sediminis TaxID=3079856 RepID=UPI00290F5AB7|nr:DUF1810 domain-containing protein [Rhodophyticola sp. MJ-SS7]MDU8946706.1 DUF1810 domain-containing protein [Rhodophyticola sp. MJ-SS7]
MYDLERFVAAHEQDYETALSELRLGKKTSHWIWYIFPQLKGLGYSERSKFYGIEDIHEARAFLNDPVLGPRYLSAVEALLGHSDIPIEDIMGVVDAKKLRSSLTLMQLAGGGPILRKALDAFFDGELCQNTLKLLNSSRHGTSH